MQLINNLAKHPIVRQFIKYVIVGCIVTAIDMAVLHLFYRILHTHIKVAVIIGFMSGNVSSFVFNKYYTFRNFSTAIIRQYTKYFVTSMTGLFWTLVLMTLFFETLGLFSGITKYNYLLCKMLVAVLVMFWNFTIIRHWTLASYELPALKNISEYGKTNKVYLSVIVPAYNEQFRLPQTLISISSWLQKQDFSYEIIVVDDGSTDSMLEAIKQELSNLPHLSVYSLTKNQGKGTAVRAGMLVSDGEYRLFMDADHQIDISELREFLPQLGEKQVLIASKYMQKADDRAGAKIRASRQFVSRLGNLIIRLMFNINVKDTQCGFKLFPSKLAESVFRMQLIKGFAFDVEILTLVKLYGYRIIELPITLKDTEESRVRTVKDSIRVFCDLLIIKLNIWRKMYRISDGVNELNHQVLRIL